MRYNARIAGLQLIALASIVGAVVVSHPAKAVLLIIGAVVATVLSSLAD